MTDSTSAAPSHHTNNRREAEMFLFHLTKLGPEVILVSKFSSHHFLKAKNAECVNFSCL